MMLLAANIRSNGSSVQEVNIWHFCILRHLRDVTNYFDVNHIYYGQLTMILKG